MGERIERELVTIQPSDDEIFSAFILFSPKGIPQDQTLLALGVKAAAAVAPFLFRFIDAETGDLTEETRDLIVKLQESVFRSQNGVFEIDPLKTQAVTSSTRMYFTTAGIKKLKEAAGVAQEVWSQGSRPQ